MSTVNSLHVGWSLDATFTLCLFFSLRHFGHLSHSSKEVNTTVFTNLYL